MYVDGSRNAHCFGYEGKRTNERKVRRLAFEPESKRLNISKVNSIAWSNTCDTACYRKQGTEQLQKHKSSHFQTRIVMIRAAASAADTVAVGPRGPAATQISEQQPPYRTVIGPGPGPGPGPRAAVVRVNRD